MLKPALRLMSDYRLRIEEIRDSKVVTSYTRWLESVQVKGAQDQEVYVTFSPLFERIWLESKNRLREDVAQNQPTWDFEANMLCGCTLGRKRTLGLALRTFHWSSSGKCSDWSR